MANNRIYATCHNPAHGEPQSRLIAKFYPNADGWYEPDFAAQAWQQFLEAHSVCFIGMWGNEYIRLTFEIPPENEPERLNPST